MTQEQIWALVAVLIFIIIDMVSGILKAIKNKELSSTVMREGLWHKSGFILFMVLIFAVEFFGKHIEGFQFDLPMFIPACIIIVGVEVLSIIENIGALSPELANNKIMQYFDEGKIKEGVHVKRD